MICRRCWVSGRVQGVWFRASTAREAHKLGVSGYARNLNDQRVEVLACGSEQAVDALCSWLWQGPTMAQVDEVSCETVIETPAPGFRQF